jgi:hypothetical protein
VKRPLLFHYAPDDAVVGSLVARVRKEFPNATQGAEELGFQINTAGATEGSRQQGLGLCADR